MTIWVCGELLVDRIGQSNILGGGPANTARAIARLGEEVEFIGGISSDQFGVRARADFIAEGVGLHFLHGSDKPTATATVTVAGDGMATYAFITANTATFEFTTDWLPDPSRFKPSAMHIGSLATVIEPGASALFEWATRVCEFAPIIFDPNVRPDALNDRSIYLEIFEKWAGISTVVKASEDDIAWLYPELNESEIISSILELGVQLLVLTRGSAGLSAFTQGESLNVSGVATQVVDTVGAGDTVGAVIADALVTEGIINLHGSLLLRTLNCAAHAAAITCSRTGAQPPTRDEIDTAIERSENAVH